MGKRKPISQSEIKMVLSSLLEVFDGVCKRHGIKYSLGYGTLLGAARHKGFIPWDDDIDVIVPLPDYLKLISLPEFNETSSRYRLHTIDVEKEFHEIYPYPFAKLVDESTEGVYMRTKDRFGAYIDIFPVVGVPEDRKLFLRFFKEFDLNKRGIAIGHRIDRDRKLTFFQRIKIIRRRFYRRKLGKYRNAMRTNMLKYEYDHSSKVNVSYWNYGIKEVFPRSMFDNMIELQFENKMYPCLECYNDYLTQMYGDWHKLPPIEMRVPRHEYNLYYKSK